MVEERENSAIAESPRDIPPLCAKDGPFRLLLHARWLSSQTQSGVEAIDLTIPLTSMSRNGASDSTVTPRRSAVRWMCHFGLRGKGSQCGRDLYARISFGIGCLRGLAEGSFSKTDVLVHI